MKLPSKYLLLGLYFFIAFLAFLAFIASLVVLFTGHVTDDYTEGILLIFF